MTTTTESHEFYNGNKYNKELRSWILCNRLRTELIGRNLKIWGLSLTIGGLFMTRKNVQKRAFFLSNDLEKILKFIGLGGTSSMPLQSSMDLAVQLSSSPYLFVDVEKISKKHIDEWRALKSQIFGMDSLVLKSLFQQKKDHPESALSEFKRDEQYGDLLSREATQARSPFEETYKLELVMKLIGVAGPKLSIFYERLKTHVQGMNEGTSLNLVATILSFWKWYQFQEKIKNPKLISFSERPEWNSFSCVNNDNNKLIPS